MLNAFLAVLGLLCIVAAAALVFLPLGVAVFGVGCLGLSYADARGGGS